MDTLSGLDTSLDDFDMEFSRKGKKSNFQNTKKMDDNF